jgi:hypothetical protein
MMKTMAIKDTRLTGMNNELGQALAQRSEDIEPVTPRTLQWDSNPCGSSAPNALTNRRKLRKSR